jgi:hypothetical protein
MFVHPDPFPRVEKTARDIMREDRGLILGYKYGAPMELGSMQGRGRQPRWMGVKSQKAEVRS